MSSVHLSESSLPTVRSVAHFTDFSDGDEVAFAHALAIALVQRASLTILHAGADRGADWSGFPAVRSVLERWKLLEPGSRPSDVFERLGVRVEKALLKKESKRAMLTYVEDERPDLLVFSTARRRGFPAFLHPSKSQTIARRSRTLTLFVGVGVRPFVSPEDGHLSLRRILVPIDRTPDATQAIVAATRAASGYGDLPVEITLLHVGEGTLPPYPRPESADWIWRDELRRGDIIEEILEEAEANESDLIVTATDGRNGVLDALRGSFTERIVAGAPCPVLAVPAPT
ncbi:MAG: universal stress protein [bacterium]|nr:universal stress protein [bacterium]